MKEKTFYAIQRGGRGGRSWSGMLTPDGERISCSGWFAVFHRQSAARLYLDVYGKDWPNAKIVAVKVGLAPSGGRE